MPTFTLETCVCEKNVTKWSKNRVCVCVEGGMLMTVAIYVYYRIMLLFQWLFFFILCYLLHLTYAEKLPPFPKMD